METRPAPTPEGTQRTLLALQKSVKRGHGITLQPTQAREIQALLALTMTEAQGLNEKLGVLTKVTGALLGARGGEFEMSVDLFDEIDPLFDILLSNDGRRVIVKAVSDEQTDNDAVALQEVPLRDDATDQQDDDGVSSVPEGAEDAAPEAAAGESDLT